MKLGILGGTFDPIHQGHLRLAIAAQKEFSLKKVIFIPAFLPPHKETRENLTPADLRYRMVLAAIAPFPQFEISDCEIRRAGVSYTIDTVRGIRHKYPQEELYFIVGLDTLREFSTWRDAEEIQRELRFLVARRKGSSEAIDALPEAQWISMPECPISSSEIRLQIQNGNLPRRDLPEAVADFIENNRLYRKCHD